MDDIEDGMEDEGDDSRRVALIQETVESIGLRLETLLQDIDKLKQNSKQVISNAKKHNNKRKSNTRQQKSG